MQATSRSHEFMRMKMLEQHWSGWSQTENLRGLNLAAAKNTAVQVAKQAGIVAQVNNMKHDLQYQASTDRVLYTALIVSTKKWV
jgi:hypothetical protein